MFRQIIAIIRGGQSALEATQARSVLWMCMDYDSSSVVSCREMQASVYTLGCICWLFYFDTTRCSVQLSTIKITTVQFICQSYTLYLLNPDATFFLIVFLQYWNSKWILKAKNMNKLPVCTVIYQEAVLEVLSKPSSFKIFRKQYTLGH
jgi:hypothetical protein